MAALKLDEEVIFNTARKMEAAPLREEYLQQVCGGDEALRGRVLALLQAHEEEHSFLRAPAEELLGTVDTPPITERPGSVIGPYELMEQIGEGGFGLVFVAEQQEPVRRKVALKIVKPGMDSGEVIARFEAERQALALMEHPNIARIFDGGTTQSGRPYFVMELVKGIPIIEYCDQQQLTARQRLDLFLVVCQAVQHAHGKGIIHRDLKPSNILVAPHDGVPVVKVIDFGVAKAIGQQLTNKKIYTRFTQMIGTPLYMSPEQAEINALDVDIRSDAYSLGVLLYELLTGTTPFDKQRFATAAYDEIRRIIKEEEPPKPSTRLTTLGDGLPKVSAQRKTEPAKLSALVRGDLDWIVMKCLEKERGRRYETANGLAKDVERYLKDEAVEACPPSAGYRLRKFLRRNKGPATAAAVVLIALLLGTIGATLGLVRAVDAEAEAVAARDQEAQQRLTAEDQRNRAVVAEANARKSAQRAKVEEEKANLLRVKAMELAQEEKVARELASEQAKIAYVERQKAQENATKAEWRLYASHIASAQKEWESNNVSLLYHFLDQCVQEFRGWEHDYLYTLANQNQQTLRGHKGEVYSVAFSPDGKRLASGSGGFNQPGTVKLWDVASGREILTFKGHSNNNEVHSVAFSPDGKRLASASVDFNRISELKMWDVASGNEIWTLQTGPAWRVAFSPDGKLLAVAGGVKARKGKGPGLGTVTLWDAASRRQVLTLEGHTDIVNDVAFSPDGRRLASASSDKTVKLWELASGKEYLTFKGHTDAVRSVAFSPDGKRLATASRDQTVKLWDADSDKELLTLPGHKGWVTSVVFSSDGKRLASASWDQTVKLWDAASGRELQTLKGHTSVLDSVAFSPDGKRLATASQDKTVKLWNAAGVQQAPGLTLRGHGGKVNAVAFSPDGKRLASGSEDHTVKLWDAVSGKDLMTLEGHAGRVNSVAFSPDGKHLASAGGVGDKQPGEVKLWDAASGKELLAFQGHQLGVKSVAFSPDGKHMVTASRDQTLKLWDAASGKDLLTFRGHTRDIFGMAFSSDGKRLASAAFDSTVKVWDAASGKDLLTLPGHTPPNWSVAFSPDGKRLASAPWHETVKLVKLWDAASGKELLSLKGHTALVTSMVFSPDGKRLATASFDNTVKLWDANSGQEVLTLRHGSAVNSVAFSPDGKRLASASGEEIIIWDASKSMKELEQK